MEARLLDLLLVSATICNLSQPFATYGISGIYPSILYLTFSLAMYLTYIPEFYLAFYLTYILTFYLAYILAFYLAFCLACHLAVEVPRCPLAGEVVARRKRKRRAIIKSNNPHLAGAESPNHE